MRRARQREMENQADPTLQSQIANSQFYRKVTSLPVVKFGINKASDMYSRVKGFNSLTNMSFNIAESVGGAAVGVVTPFAQKGISFAGPGLEKIDTLATVGLTNIEAKVPVITKQPDAIVSNVNDTIAQWWTAVKSRVNEKRDQVLVTKPVQTVFDLCEFIVSTMGSALDKVIPPTDDESQLQNEPYPAPEKSADRGIWIIGAYFTILKTIKFRLYDKYAKKYVQSSADFYANTKETIQNIAHPATSENDQKAPLPNGEVKQNNPTTSSNAPSNKQGKKKQDKNATENAN